MPRANDNRNIMDILYVSLGIITNTFSLLVLNINSVELCSYYFGSGKNELAFLADFTEGVGYVIRPLATASLFWIRQRCGNSYEHAMCFVAGLHALSNFMLCLCPSYDASIMAPFILILCHVIQSACKAIEHPFNTLVLLGSCRDEETRNIASSTTAACPAVGLLLLLFCSSIWQPRQVVILAFALTFFLFLFRLYNLSKKKVGFFASIQESDNSSVSVGGFERLLDVLRKLTSNHMFFATMIGIIYVFQAQTKIITGWWSAFMIRNNVFSSIEGKQYLAAACVVSVLCRLALPTKVSQYAGRTLSLYGGILVEALCIPLLYLLSFKNYPLLGAVLIQIPHSVSHGLLFAHCNEIFSGIISMKDFAIAWNIMGVFSLIFLPIPSLICYNLGAGINTVILLTVLFSMLCILVMNNFTLEEERRRQLERRAIDE